MKKIVLAFAVAMMTATYSVATYAAVSSTVTVKQDDKKKKTEGKSCCQSKSAEQKAHCESKKGGEQGKSCCQSKGGAEKK